MTSSRINEYSEYAKQCIRQGRLSEAKDQYHKICQLDTTNAEAWLMLGALQGDLGELEQAVASFGKAIRIFPDKADAHYKLAGILHKQGKLQDAANSLKLVTRLDPGFVEAWCQLALVYGKMGMVSEAENAARRAIQIQPDMADAHVLIGNALCSMSRFDEAIGHYQQALARKPDLLEANFKLGNALTMRGRPGEAVSFYRRALEIDPKFLEGYNRLGIALLKLKAYHEAIAVYEKILSIYDKSPGIYANMANVYAAMGHLCKAEESLKRAAKLNPNIPNVHCNLGVVLNSEGKTEEALESFRQALALDPAFAKAHSNILLCLNYLQNRSPESVYKEHLQWAKSYENQDSVFPAHENDPDPGKRLHIGYVSPDICAHSVAYFLGNILANHDPACAEIYCYADVSAPDTVTSHLRALSQHWRDTCGLSNASVAGLIREDRIDILVDLAGHTANNRLTLFATKPAPVQVTYLGYPNTTGLRNMDYRITDSWADPPGMTERYHSETLVRLPGGFLCYQPPSGMPTISPLPARQNGYITFASFNNLSKVTTVVIDLWAELLRTIPRARLLLKNKSLNDPATRERYAALLKDRDIQPERIELLGSQPSLTEHLAIYNRVDIGLDTFPYNGTTTTCESLWMGVPVITLAGQVHASRVGLSLLSQAGLGEFIASEPARYIAIARELSADLDRLEKLRATLRQLMEGTSLCDGKRFTQNLEQAYRQMWLEWCQRRRSG
jgi:predicted O-linked N-acetylglucosamine transferase (SPINDLY family)